MYSLALEMMKWRLKWLKIDIYLGTSPSVLTSHFISASFMLPFTSEGSLGGGGSSFVGNGATIGFDGTKGINGGRGRPGKPAGHGGGGGGRRPRNGEPGIPGGRGIDGISGIGGINGGGSKPFGTLGASLLVMGKTPLVSSDSRNIGGGIKPFIIGGIKLSSFFTGSMFSDVSIFSFPLSWSTSVTPPREIKPSKYNNQIK